MGTESELLRLAKEEFGELSKLEELFFYAVVEGKLAKYIDPIDNKNDPKDAAKWGDNRIIKAEHIAWLCKNLQAKEQVPYLGIKIKGVRIDGELDLGFVRISFPLYFDNCAFPLGINLYKAEISTLLLNDVHTGTIDANSLKVQDDLFIANTSISGEVNLNGTVIGGNFECNGSRFINSGKTALNGDNLRVGGNVGLIDIKAEGQVSLRGATISGDLSCNNSSFSNENATAFLADSLSVKGCVLLCDQFKAVGGVLMRGATIGQVLDCHNGQFINPEGAAFIGINIKVDGDVLLNLGYSANGKVVISGATIGGVLDCRGGKVVCQGKDGALIADKIKVINQVYLSDGFRAEGGVTLDGTNIGGDLLCDKGEFINKESIALTADKLRIDGDVRLCNEFKAEGKVSLFGATIGGNLNCINGKFTCPNKDAFIATMAKVGNDVYLSQGFSADGRVSLMGTTIVGNLECNGGRFVNKEGKALSADSLQVKGSVFLSKGFHAEGIVQLAGANIEGMLSCEGGYFKNPDGMTLVADGIKVDRGVALTNGFKSEGEVRFVSAFIGRDFDCSKGEFINEGGSALSMDGSQLNGSLGFREGFKAIGKICLVSVKVNKYLEWRGVVSPADIKLDLRTANVGVLADELDSWPENGKLFLDGLVYTRIDDDAPHDPGKRLDWLRRQPSFQPQPYEQLAEVLKRSGYEKDATEVLIAKNADRIKNSPKLGILKKVWYRLFGLTMGYGYKPLNMLWVMFLFLLIGWIVFGFGAKHGLITPTQGWAYKTDATEKKMISKEYPAFNFWIYSIDTFVPLVDLQQSKYWLPNVNKGEVYYCFIKWIKNSSGGWLRIYLCIHIVFGWLLTTLLVVGLMGLVRK